MKQSPPKRFEVFWTDLDPARGFEMKKCRPCVIVSPDTLNRYVKIVIVAPLTSTQRVYPTRIATVFQGVASDVVLDQLRTVDRSRLIRHAGVLDSETAARVCETLQELFAY